MSRTKTLILLDGSLAKKQLHTIQEGSFGAQGWSSVRRLSCRDPTSVGWGTRQAETIAQAQETKSMTFRDNNIVQAHLGHQNLIGKRRNRWFGSC